MASSSSDDFSVMVLASDLGIDARPFLSHPPEEDNWHDCPSYLPSADDQNLDFSDLDALQFLRLERGSDKAGNRILRVVGKYFPAPVITGERLKKYVFHKIFTEVPEGPFCIVYMHSTVQKEDNSPGITILRWIYEELPNDYKDRLQVVYFIHPGLRSRLVFATLGRFLLSGGLYWKIKYISRLQYLWQDIKKGELEIPEFVKEHDDILEHRPLTDYGIEPDPLHLMEVPSTAYSLGGMKRSGHQESAGLSRWSFNVQNINIAFGHTKATSTVG
ncbi:UNVERIFIED_CONTAM: hypothetical protein Slati_3026200 [Sesamum latifolium]|uniref:CRAL-TRIO domain-containing protein n=1 Tax=Sesamum latifolium TaxID=2727402 RepID=A0AAW2VFJ6_9LAMI